MKSLKTVFILLFAVALAFMLASCGEEKEDDAPEHTHTEVIIPEEPATCTTKGLTEGRQCGVCGFMTLMPQVIEQLNHDYNGNECVRCGDLIPSEGFDFILTPDGKGYYVLGTPNVTDRHVVVPSYHEDGLPITMVYPGSTFAECAPFEELTLPDTVTHIWIEAFAGCTSMKKVNLPDSLEYVMVGAFKGCTSLESVIVPAGAKYEGSVFEGCVSLKEVTLSEGLETVYIDMFRDCTSLKEIVIPNSVKKIEWGAFAGCTSLERVVLSENLERIEQAAFLECINLIKTVDNGVSYIGSESNPYMAVLGGSNLDNVFICYGARFILDNAFSLCNLENAYIPSSVISISNGAFQINCTGFSTYEDMYKAVGDWVIYCSDVEKLEIAENIVGIAYGAANYCKSIKELIFLGKPKYINSYAFSSCESLELIYYSGTKEEWEAIAKEDMWNYGSGDFNLVFDNEY